MSTNREELYHALVEKKYNLYNSMFLSLPFKNIRNIGTFIPLLEMECQKGFEEKRSPVEIIDNFFLKHTQFSTEEQRIQFMFQVIQYVERQVVLFDAIEDASFSAVSALSANLNVADIIKNESLEKRIEIVQHLLENFSVRLVFTAHPTQFYPHTVLDILQELKEEIEEDLIEKIDVHLQQLGLTTFLQKEKPTPLEEASNIIYYLQNVYYDAIAQYYGTIKNLLLPFELHNPNLLKIGFWPGGDRDGNPFVTTQTTQSVAKELRSTLMRCYYQDAQKLEKKLTFTKTYPLIQKLRQELYEAIFSDQPSKSYQDILNTLHQLKELLHTEYNQLYINDLNEFIYKVEIFKNHFASLDIRQNHEVHVQIISQILQHNGLITHSMDELSETALQKALFQTPLKTDFQFQNDENGVLQDTFENFKTIALLQKLGGEEACNRYIISNSEDQNAVLFVLALFRIQGYTLEKIPVDIIPLFETMKGMQDSHSIMSSLFNNTYYSKHLAHRKRNQTIMLGFSDGTKDGGYLKANWSIFKTKESLSVLCEKKQIKVLFFDGRGGPPARGGGKTHRFYASQSDKIANHDIELTIQGQTITSTYGTQEQFLYNCDQMLTAGLQNQLSSSKEKHISDTHRKWMEELSELSFQAYDELKHHPQFIPYLEQMSTLQYYGKANIGSRPGKRGSKAQLTLEDLRAISFVGAWSQLKQNVPGFYGIGAAIQKFKEEGRIEQVKELWKDVKFFNALMKNSMMSLEKSFFPLTEYMSENETFKEFWNLLYSEYQRTYSLLLEISDYSELMQEEPISKASIDKREEIVLPLLTIQQYALLKIQENPPQKEVYEKLVVRSLYGNINASRNSA